MDKPIPCKLTQGMEPWQWPTAMRKTREWMILTWSSTHTMLEAVKIQDAMRTCHRTSLAWVSLSKDYRSLHTFLVQQAEHWSIPHSDASVWTMKGLFLSGHFRTGSSVSWVFRLLKSLSRIWPCWVAFSWSGQLGWQLRRAANRGINCL